ncbi:MAG TPA: ribosomal protein S18-alanine N-acetyltransferase [Anaerolineales bacterium]|nr:ribosomal protein S18-alanine N-acetyltransferase [Anaerolineales bacterium]
MNMIIRKMILDDMEQVIAIDRMSFSLPWPERSFRFELTDNPASRCWVAEMDGKLVGMIVAWLIVDEVHVATIATHPDFRRQGIAKRLLSHALRELRNEGAQSSFLEVRASNFAAQDMYRKFGYEQSGIRPRYYRDNDEDALLMTLESLNVERLEDQEA